MDHSHYHKKIIFASPDLPDFDASNFGKRVTRLLGLLAEECEVYAFTLGRKPEKCVHRLETGGVKVLQTTDFGEVRRLVPQVDVLIFSFYYTWFDCGELLRLYPNARQVMDAGNVHWVRHERSIGLEGKLAEDEAKKKKALEIEVYRKAEVIWTITDYDRQAILAEVPEANVQLVSNVHPIVVAGWQDPGNDNLLFCGNFSHYPNIVEAKELVFRYFPKIREQMPGATLLIAGPDAPPDVVALGRQPGVEFIGPVDENQLKDLYRKALLALVPLQTGGGIKAIICEAIAYGVPVVTNSVGNEVIELVNEESGLVSRKREGIIELTVKALRREYDFKNMVAAAQDRLQSLVGPAVVKKSMFDSLSQPGTPGLPNQAPSEGGTHTEKPAETLARMLTQVAETLQPLHFNSISNPEFERINDAYQKVVKGIKKISYRPGDRKDVDDFEKKWAAQSIQFMMEIMPDIQGILLKYYEHHSVLECADIGAGSGAGTNLIAQIHADHIVYSKMNVTAVDHIDHRVRWAISQYPLMNYKVANLYGLPSKSYDIVVCNACMEHVTYPEKFTWELVRICRGFAFVYTPYDEQDLIPGHINRITEEFYKDFPVEQLRIFHSMGWSGDLSDKKMILAILDCRSS